MSTADEARAEKMCPACTAYIAHYPVMADEWECEHTGDEQAFMLALADAIHGPDPQGEFVDAGWRAAQFLDDAEVALDCGHAPYIMRITHNVEPWSFLALVNGRYLIGTRNDEGAELESVADIGWLGIASRKPEAAPSDTDRETAIASIEYSRGTHIKWRDWLHVNPDDPAAEIAGDVTAHEQFIARYDNVLAVLRTSQPVQVEVTDDMVNSAAGAIQFAIAKPGWTTVSVARAALSAALGGDES